MTRHPPDDALVADLKTRTTCDARAYVVRERVGEGGLARVHACEPSSSTVVDDGSSAHRRFGAPLVMKRARVDSARVASRVAAEIDALRRIADVTTDARRRWMLPTFVDAFVARDDDDDDDDASPSSFVACVVSRRHGDGATLASLLDVARAAAGTGAPLGLPELQARHLASQLALALDALHRVAAIVHGDVKPENALVDRAHRIQLCDFDLATSTSRPAVADAEDDLAEENDEDEYLYAFCGTAEYLAPETIAGAPRSAARDWWALAITMYELVHGKTPFASSRGNDEVTMRRVRTVRIDWPDPPGVSDACRGVISAMLRRQPSTSGGGEWDVSARLCGERGLEDLKRASFFRGVDWDRVGLDPPASTKGWVVLPQDG